MQCLTMQEITAIVNSYIALTKFTPECVVLLEEVITILICIDQ